MTQKISSVNIESATLSSFTGPTISSVAIANSTYVILDDTAVSNAGGYAVITGTNFASGAQVLFGSTSATAVTYVNSTTLNVQVPALTAGSYVMYVQNPDGSTAIRLNGITSSPTPVWGTDSALTQQDAGAAFSISLAASSDSNVTFALSSGSTLPPGTTLAANGVFSGTITVEEETTYNFSVDAIDVENQETLRSFSITIVTGDQYYKNTVLHLNGETVSNTWITDVSSNALTITVNGDTRPMAFSPYETVWSNSFDGTDDYLSITANSAFNLPGDFTMECWAYWRTLPGNSMLLDTYVAGDNGSYQLYWRSTGSSIAFYTPGDGVILQDPSSSTIVTNRWHHIAVTRSGTTARLFIDGVQKASATLTRDLTHDNSFTIGTQLATLTNDINGYISNVRLIKGTALYTSNFTPSTTALTAVENTVLLTCQSNRFIDNSNNNFAITIGNNTSISSFGPFTETDVTTGSAYFDGTGDYLDVANVDTAFGTSSDFTIDFWMYPTVIDSTIKAIFDPRTTDASAHPLIWINVSNRLYYFTTNATRITGTTTLTANQWYHVALVRSSGTTTLYLNGSVEGTWSDTTDYITSTTFRIGQRYAATAYNYAGYISNFRVVNGTAVYTSAFTPPTSPLTAITNTSLLTLQSRIGENNNRFLDSSGLNNIITRSGNVTQGTFSPYSLTGWSNYFDGTGDYLTTSYDSSLTAGTGDFCIEAWVYMTDSLALNDSIASVSGDWQVSWQTSGFCFMPDGSTRLVNTNALEAMELHRWYHVAFTRESGTMRSYLNGVFTGSSTGAAAATNHNDIVNGLVIGNNRGGTGYFTGYIADVRYVVGSAVYTTESSFTLPTSPLTAITNTKLLTCQNNQFIDNSTNNLTITKTGDTKVQPFSPFKPTGQWSANTVGGSMYFDGTGDYLDLPSNEAFTLGTGDFTIEGWIYVISGTTGTLYDSRTGTTTVSPVIYLNSGVLTYFVAANRITGPTLVSASWHHVAVVRQSSSTKMYLNGVQVGSTYADTNNYVIGPPKIGAGYANGNLLNGYISNLRVIKGTALYTSAFTPPTSPLTAISGTTLLLNGTNGGIIDYTGKNNLETVGDAKIRNNVVKYGNGSMYFDGTGDYLLVPSSSNLDFGTGDFTIEFWLNLANVTSTWQAIISRAYNVTGGWRLYKNDGTAELRWYAVGTSVVLTSSSGIANNTWSHVAVVRNGTTLTIYVDGTNRGSATNTTSYNPGNYAVEIGSGVVTSAYPVTGYIDDLRITKGYARYTANFTPPNVAFNTK